MDKFLINDRFIVLYSSLIADKKIEGKGDLATKLGVKASTISEIMGKRQGVTTQFIQKFCEIFPEFQPNDFFPYTESIDVTPVDSDKERIIKALKDHLIEKTDRLKDKDIIIATKDEALILWKEKALAYEKKISVGSSALGNKRSARPAGHAGE